FRAARLVPSLQCGVERKNVPYGESSAVAAKNPADAAVVYVGGVQCLQFPESSTSYVEPASGQLDRVRDVLCVRSHLLRRLRVNLELVRDALKVGPQFCPPLSRARALTRERN